MWIFKYYFEIKYPFILIGYLYNLLCLLFINIMYNYIYILISKINISIVTIYIVNNM